MVAKTKAKKKAKARMPKIKVVNLKEMAKSPAKFQALLKEIQKKKIGIGILNAPFKLRGSPTAS